MAFTARYLAFVFNTRVPVNGQYYGYSLYEVEAYGSESSYVPKLLGDADKNGEITTTDARLALQYAAGKIGEEALDAAVTDVDGDGRTSTTDARLILQKAAKKIDQFPVER